MTTDRTQRGRTKLHPIAALATLLLLAPVALFAGVDTKRAEGVDFAKFTTFRWKSDASPVGPDLDRQLRAAAREGFAKKGLREAKPGEAADLVLTYNAGAADQLVADIDVDLSWWGGFYLAPGGRSTVRAGILFSFAEAESGRVVWAGWVVKSGNNANALQVMRKRAPSWAKKIAETYPR